MRRRDDFFDVALYFGLALADDNQTKLTDKFTSKLLCLANENRSLH